MEVTSIFLNRILLLGAKRQASGLFLSVGSLPSVRLDGRIKSLPDEDIVSSELIESVIRALLDEAQLEELKQNRSVCLTRDLAGDLRFKVTIFYQKNLPSVAFKYISNVIPDIDRIDIPQEFKNLVGLGSGLIVVAGAYGSGRTATIVSFLSKINKEQHKKIITLENPIEYILISQKSIIEQREVKQDVVSFSVGIDDCLRLDSDLLYVSDLGKDMNLSIPSIFELASGNTLVILEMNASSSIQAVEYLLSALETVHNKEAARYFLADILKSVLVQRLIPKKGGGMATAVEFFSVNPAARSLLRDGNFFQIDNIIQTSRKDGMVSMQKSLEDLQETGEIKQDFEQSNT